MELQPGERVDDVALFGSLRVRGNKLQGALCGWQAGCTVTNGVPRERERGNEGNWKAESATKLADDEKKLHTE